jgi:hypothetical protein
VSKASRREARKLNLAFALRHHRKHGEGDDAAGCDAARRGSGREREREEERGRKGESGCKLQRSQDLRHSQRAATATGSGPRWKNTQTPAPHTPCHTHHATRSVGCDLPLAAIIAFPHVQPRPARINGCSLSTLIRLPGHPIGSPARRDDEEAGGYESGGRRRPPRRPRRDSGHGRQGQRRQGAGSPPRPAPPASFCQICWRDSSGGLIVPGAGTGAR